MDIIIDFISFSDGLTFDSIISLFVVMCIANCFATVCGNLMKGVKP